MTIRKIPFGGAWVIEARRFGDERGWFQEWFRRSQLEEATGVRFEPMQANISQSRSGTIRGIHYSVAAAGQAKLVTVMSGAIDDYVIDIDHRSPTFGRWERITLSSADGTAVLISAHMGHAFQALTDDTVVSYLVSSEFDPSAEKGVNPLCPHVAIDWRDDLEVLISAKDSGAPDLLGQRDAGGLPFQ